MLHLINIFILLCPCSKEVNDHFKPTIEIIFHIFTRQSQKQCLPMSEAHINSFFLPMSISEYVICTVNTGKTITPQRRSNIAHTIASMNQIHSGKTQIKSKFDGMFIRLGVGAALCLLSMEKTKHSF